MPSKLTRKEVLLRVLSLPTAQRKRLANIEAARRGLNLPPVAEPKQAQNKPSGLKIAPSGFDQRVEPNSTDWATPEAPYLVEMTPEQATAFHAQRSSVSASQPTSSPPAEPPSSDAR